MKGKPKEEEKKTVEESDEGERVETEGSTESAKQVSQGSSEQGKGLGMSAEKKREAPQIDQKVKFKDFEIMKVIGEGSFGRVFKVRKIDNGEVLALKVMKKQTLINNNQVKYAVSEAEIMKELDHPYILKLMYSFQTPTNLFMAVEFCENGDLAEILDDHSLFDEEVAKFLIA